MILAARDLVTGYGLGAVIHGVSFDVGAGEVVCLLGRNGAGKSTTLRSVMGLTPPRSGRVEFMGDEITGRPPFEIARLGIGYIPDDFFHQIFHGNNTSRTPVFVQNYGHMSPGPAQVIQHPLRSAAIGNIKGFPDEILEIERGLILFVTQPEVFSKENPD